MFRYLCICIPFSKMIHIALKIIMKEIGDKGHTSSIREKLGFCFLGEIGLNK